MMPLWQVGFGAGGRQVGVAVGAGARGITGVRSQAEEKMSGPTAKRRNQSLYFIGQNLQRHPKLGQYNNIPCSAILGSLGALIIREQSNQKGSGL
jgi:hypothetical protein